MDTDLSWEGEDDIYLHDLATSTTTMITTNPSRTDSADGFSVAPTFSPDGGRIVFGSTASDLGAEDANGTTDVFVYDVASDSLGLVSVNAAGTAAANGPLGVSLVQPRRLLGPVHERRQRSRPNGQPPPRAADPQPGRGHLRP